MTSPRSILNAPSLYPVTLGYVSAVIILLLISMGWVDIGVGILILGCAAALIILWSMRREVAVVSHLVNSQHDDLMERVDQLTAALVKGGLAVPTDPAKPKTAAAAATIRSKPKAAHA
jgi:hypothetical protein